jgi:hypothetical protein
MNYYEKIIRVPELENTAQKMNIKKVYAEANTIADAEIIFEKTYHPKYTVAGPNKIDSVPSGESILRS